MRRHAKKRGSVGLDTFSFKQTQKGTGSLRLENSCKECVNCFKGFDLGKLKKFEKENESE